MIRSPLHPFVSRKSLHIEGVVQGVGFRPFVYSLAQRFGLSGHVGNDSSGVFIEVEGDPLQIEAFQLALTLEPPPLAHIEAIQVQTIQPLGHMGNPDGFVIVESSSDPAARTLLSPDYTLCEDCERELLDPTNRRYRYPFINCTNCGPRFTIIRDVPYDRPLTTMAEFEMCPACQAEYDDPLDRRFHAQPNACPTCGPQVWLERDGQPINVASGALFTQIDNFLRQGEILAVKGLGGFHLACDAYNHEAVALLRDRKGRVGKPFAVMAKDVETIRRFADVSKAEVTLLQSQARPIVLVKKRESFDLADQIAPGNQFVGVMLPCTPLHVLLLENVPVLVMTSGNASGVPIVYENSEARIELKGLADLFVMHDRPIHNRCDDSVVRILDDDANDPIELPMRRSRGYAPFPVRLPMELPPVLAAGGELKATFCLAQGKYGYMSQHIGDMENWETVLAYESAVERLSQTFRSEPKIVACDLHPGYLSTQWAKRYVGGRPLVEVQHHHAHIASVMAENGLKGDEAVIGFAFDGTGYGTDGAIWGGEVLVADYAGFERPFHLSYCPLPGGDTTVKKPYRMALAHLWEAGMWGHRDGLPPTASCSEAELKLLRQQLEKNINCVPTSSMGRLFDAVAALIDGRQTITYEGQAAIELEALADPQEKAFYSFDVENQSFSANPIFKQIIADWGDGVPRSIIAQRFHNGIAHLILTLSERVREARGLQTVVLSGGVFQNINLVRQTLLLLKNAGFRPLLPTQLPANDGGLALGQAMIAAAKLQARK